MMASAHWQKGLQFEAQSGSGKHITLDGESGEQSGGPNPMETVLMALCGCTAIDIVSILKKKREPLTGLTVSATAEQAPQPPRVFTHIRLTYRVSGAVSHKGMEDAVALTKNTYCSVSKMLEKTAAIDFDIVYEADENETSGNGTPASDGSENQTGA